ncbi:hypothetical protein NEDG_01591 [Nematocida displodere]|uniref:Uncharacterized protein n=1 Tax=Nematocida displodere TaxID=1805483 RepID=A0A177EH29_9MICR|nr:hypothetical protein NEDG_01591 [Nematocida displodere]
MEPRNKNHQASMKRLSLVPSTEKQLKELDELAGYYHSRPAACLSLVSSGLELAQSLATQDRPRRYSDQFKAPSTDTLAKEVERNRKARVVCKFITENQDIDNVTAQWKEVVLEAFEDLVSEEEVTREEAYTSLSLKAISITKEDVGLE